MRNVVLGASIVVGLVVAAVGAMPEPNAVHGQRMDPSQSASAGRELITHATVVDGRYQQLVVLDPKRESLAVYQVELATGNVELCCVRKISWDLQMTYFNGKSPLPPEIQSLIEHR